MIKDSSVTRQKAAIISIMAICSGNWRKVFILVCTAILSACSSYAAELTVCPTCPYHDIQEAINASSNGDTVLVGDGLYSGGIEVYKRIAIRSVNGTAKTIISGGDTYAVKFGFIDATLSGFTIRWAGNGGILLDNADNCTISGNVLLGNNGDGIHIQGVHFYGIENTVYNNTFLENNGTGVYVEYSQGNNISGNSFLGDGVMLGDSGAVVADNSFVSGGLSIEYYPGDVVSFDVRNNSVNGKPLVFLNNVSGQSVSNGGEVIFMNCQNSNVSGLDLSDTPYGIILMESANCSISGNSFHNSSIKSYCSSDSIKDNILTGGGLYFDVYYVNGEVECMGTNDVRNNSVNGKPLVYLHDVSDQSIGSAGQVILYGCSNITLANQSFADTPMAVSLYGTDNSSILSNRISDASTGIYLAGSSGNRVIGNTITGSEKGIYMIISTWNLVSGCVFTDDAEGTDMSSSDWNNLSKNVFTGCRKGMYFYESRFNNVSWNNASSGGWGLYFDYWAGGSYNNVTNNLVCGNSAVDIYEMDWNNSRDDNTCDTVFYWKDASISGTYGCTYLCGYATTTTTTTTSTTTTTTTTSTTTSTTQWTPILIIGSGRGYGTGYFYDPMAVDVENGSVYVVESYNGRVQKFNLEGAYVESYGTSGSGDVGELHEPSGVAFRRADENDTLLYVADTKNDRVQIYRTYVNDSEIDSNWSAFGISLSENYFPQTNIYFDKPSGIVVDGDGVIYVVNTGMDRISIFNQTNISRVPTPRNRTEFNGSSSKDGLLNHPQGIAVYNNTVYVADTGNNMIRLFLKNGTQILSFGAAGSGRGQFSSPRSLTLDSSGIIYVADTGNNRVSIYNSQGMYVTEFGSVNCSIKVYSNSSYAEGQFCQPGGIDVKDGKLYVVDTGNHRVQVFNDTNLPQVTCILLGDDIPCGQVSLSEVINYINKWAAGDAELSDIITLINKWAAG